MRGWRPVTMAVSAAVLIAGCASAGTTRPPAIPASSSHPVGGVQARTHWLIAASAISQLDNVAGQAVVASYLDGPQTTVIIGRTIPAALKDWHVHFALDTRSLYEIRRGVASGLSPRISMILYDPERWSFTPASEQSAVGSSARTAASIAHSAGSAFMQTDDLEKVAASANWVEIQAQGLERHPARYAAYIAEALRQIRRANRDAVVYAGLSTNPSGPPVDGADLVEDVRLTSSVISGYWLNIPSPGTACPHCGQPRPQIAVYLLESLAAS